MPTKFVSFGFKHGRPPAGLDVLTVDIRHTAGIRNPWSEDHLRARNGLDPDVQRFMLTDPGFYTAVAGIRDRVNDHPGPVYIGCSGGGHRSVYVVELLSAYFEVPREHRDLNR